MFFFSDHLRIINDLFNESFKNTGKPCSAIYHKVANDQEESILIQSISIHSKKEPITIFSEINPPLEDFNQYLWEENEKLTIYLNNIVENIPASIYWMEKY